MEGRRVAVTNGCFDIFHAGHAEFLQAAAETGDVLLVAVNTDESVRRLKGDERPVNALEDRLRVLEAIGVVSAVTWFDDSTAAGVVDLAKPDAYVKGSDYRGLSFPEAELVRKYGGRVVFVDLLEGRSTSGIVERLRGSAEVAV
jgi:glycerol-3-phosphate cytidylyltransferase